MAQTTGAVANACAKVEVSYDGCTTYTDVSGTAQSVTGTNQARMSGEAYTFSGDTAIIAGGKREPMELVFAIVYTETDAEVYEQVRALFETEGCDANICVRWSPGGGNAGDEQIETAAGVIIDFIYPPVDATSGAPIMGGFTIRVPSTDTTIVAS
jgi:hypothetical protein